MSVRDEKMSVRDAVFFLLYAYYINMFWFYFMEIKLNIFILNMFFF